MKYNGNRFSVYESEEKTVLGLLDELGSLTNNVCDSLDNKTDLHGNHLGQWQGLSRPTLSDEGMKSTVEDIIDNKIPSIQSSLEKQNEDYYELGNKITVIESQLDTIKTDKVDKEEGKQLSTNDFDNNLLTLLRTWEEFKTNGGEIGGDITLSRLRELWLGDYSKNANGYTKLPNGLILQWGLATIKTSAGGGRVEVTYPISFPNASLTQSTQIKNCLNDYTATRIVTLGRAWKSSITILAQQVAGTIVTDNTNCEICWIALGY